MRGAAAVSEPRSLDDIRAEIDRIDAELVRLVNERGRLARAAGEAKRSRDGDRAPLYRPEREAQLLERVARMNPGPIGDAQVRRILVEVVSACRALELELAVAFLGPEGTFTQAAALEHFGHGVALRAQATLDAVFREVESGACDYGVVPVESSNEGVVSHTLDLFFGSSLAICGEVLLPVHQCLLSRTGTLAAVRRVRAHQQSLGQCRKWLDANLPAAEREAVSSNAEAARRAAGEPEAAAIAGRVAAGIHGLGLLAANIEDEPGNTTRFLVVGHDRVAPSGDDKTALMFGLQDRPGALLQALEVFARRGIDVTRIESRPSRLGHWRYLFHVDIAGHRDDPPAREALAELDARTDFCKVIGSFPRAAGGGGP